MIINIEVVDPIECKVSKLHGQYLIPCLSYKSVFWRQGRFGKQQTSYKKQIFSYKGRDKWSFYTGHLQRVLDFCKKKGWETNVKYNNCPSPELYTPDIPNITLRKDQKKVIKKALHAKRGVVKEPTGTGKTILQLGIISAFNDKNILLLAHTSSIVNQTVDKIRELDWSCTQIGGGQSLIGEFSRGKIIIATIQSFAKIDPRKYQNHFDIVIVDEAHRVSDFEGQYAKVLGNINASIRLGFTATPPTKMKPKLALEGFIGPLISEHTINEAVESKIIAKPKIKLIKSRFQQKVRDERKYQDVYQKGIVDNLSRNKQIVDIVKEHKEKGETSLIFINKIVHGDNLIKLFLKEKIRVPFVKGDTPEDKRKVIKTSLAKKTRKIVIATTAWKEGVDIPSLDVVFNAGGGKSEIALLQTIGRGLRRTEEKDSVIIYDFFDPSHPYLISHFGERVSIYFDNSWL